jgi:ribonuclease BN (tRNA processing enzyme)
MTAVSRRNASQRSVLRVRFWGVRGSYPTTGANTHAFGGNTSCVEVEAGGRRLIFDAGTGIIPLGKLIGSEPQPRAPLIFLSHTHIDHVVGLCFFEPLLNPKTRTYIFGPGTPRNPLAKRLEQLTHSSLFPVSLEEFKGKKTIYSLTGNECIHFPPGAKKPVIRRAVAKPLEAVDKLTITTHKSPAHPRDGVMLYRLSFNGKILVYATDVEQQENGYPDIIDFARGADLLIHDAQYLDGEYHSKRNPKVGWGHSTVEMAAEVARKAQVKRLVLFHHEPIHDDRTLLGIARRTKKLFPSSVVAREGLQISLL